MNTINDPRHLGQLDPEALLQIKNLELRARMLVDGFQTGLHRSPLHGFSVEFDEYRPYSVGDDPRSLDWKLFARSDRYCVKKYRDETNRRCYLLVDFSRSMDFGSIGYTKLQYVQTIAATLAHYLWRQRDAVGLVAFDSQVREVIPATRRHGQLQRIVARLDSQASGSATQLDLPLRQIAETIAPRGLIIVLSDFLTPLDQLELPTNLVRARGQEVCCIRILDPAEQTFAPKSAVTLRDAETGKLMYVDPVTASKQYAERFAAHRNGLAAICESAGVELIEWTTDRPLRDLMMEWLSSRQHRIAGRTASRASSRSGGGAR